MKFLLHGSVRIGAIQSAFKSQFPVVDKVLFHFDAAAGCGHGKFVWRARFGDSGESVRAAVTGLLKQLAFKFSKVKVKEIERKATSSLACASVTAAVEVVPVSPLAPCSECGCLCSAAANYCSGCGMEMGIHTVVLSGVNSDRIVLVKQCKAELLAVPGIRKVEIDPSLATIVLKGTTDATVLANQLIERFVQKHMSLNRLTWRSLRVDLSEDCKRIRENGFCSVQFSTRLPRATLRGSPAAVDLCSQKLDAVSNRILSGAISKAVDVPSWKLLAVTYAHVEALESKFGIIVEGMNRSVGAVQVCSTTIRFVAGDICLEPVAAVVSPTNAQLQLHAGIAGCLRKASGPELEHACREQLAAAGDLCGGQNVLTPGFGLVSPFVIHTVLAETEGGSGNQLNLLEKCVVNILARTCSQQLPSVCIPPLGTGAFGIPAREAIQCIAQTVCTFLRESAASSLEEVRLIADTNEKLQLFEHYVSTAASTPQQPLGSLPQGDPYDSVLFERYAGAVSDEAVDLVCFAPKHQWSWRTDDGSFCNYDSDQNCRIDQAFSRKQQTVDLVGARPGDKRARTYKVSLDLMVQENVATHFKRIIRRAEKKDSDLSASVAGGKEEKGGARRSTIPPSIGTSAVSLFTLLLRGAPVDVERALREFMDDSALQIEQADLPNVHAAVLQCMSGVSVQDSGKTISLRGHASFVRRALLLLAQASFRTNSPPKPLLIGKHAQLTHLDASSKEFIGVQNLVSLTLPQATIFSVQIVHNVLADEIFQANRRILELKWPQIPPAALCSQLFHGTRTTAPEMIWKSEHGVDLKFCRETSMWGKGIYLAHSASYSGGPSYAYRLPDGSHQMFLCDALTGVSCFLAPTSITMPPTVAEATKRHKLEPVPTGCALPDPVCDSVHGETGGTKVSVIYENGRVYPRFLITFKA